LLRRLARLDRLSRRTLVRESISNAPGRTRAPRDVGTRLQTCPARRGGFGDAARRSSVFPSTHNIALPCVTTRSGRHRRRQPAMSIAPEELTVMDNSAANRFEIHIGDDIAFLTYVRDGTAVAYSHTEVPPSLEGHGIA